MFRDLYSRVGVLAALLCAAPGATAQPAQPATSAPRPADLRPPTAAMEYMLVPMREKDPQLQTKDLRARFTPEQIDILEKLNRASARHLASLPELVVPLTWRQDAMEYSPMPLWSDWAAPYPKALIVHKPSQAFGAYEQGRLVRWGPVSTGREALPTPSGVFHLNWKTRGRHSTVDPDWYMPWYFNFHNERGLSFHEYSLPGLPASHACVRLLERDAMWLFDWGEEWLLDDRGWNVLDPGTPVWIAGQYDFDSPPPWRSLEWLSHGVTLPPPPSRPEGN